MGRMTAQARRVLIVDDHAGFRATARALLELRGFVVVGEVDRAGVAFAAVQDLEPDAVLLDVHLPDGNGIDVCRALMQADPALAVLLVSADAEAADEADDCGAVGFLPKDALGTVDLVALLSGGADENLPERATA